MLCWSMQNSREIIAYWPGEIRGASRSAVSNSAASCGAADLVIGQPDKFSALPQGPGTSGSTLSGGLTASTRAICRCGVYLMAKMYLTWKPNLPASIPVPLGFTSWELSAVAQRDQLTGSWTPSGLGSASGFQASVVYPHWTGTLANRSPECAMGGFRRAGRR
jgi:hypothetical protein